MKRYVGARRNGLADVRVDGTLLNPRLDLRKHSVTGFEWGYGGSGPSQLALAILADHLDDQTQALDLYQRFKWKVIAELPFKKWALTSQEIDEVLHSLRAQDAQTGGTE